MKILITGASGMVGKALERALEKEGMEVLKLTTSKNAGKNSFRWNAQKGLTDKLPLKEIAGVVHLAGAGIADKKWTAKRKKEILDSRVKASELLYAAFRKEGCFPQFYITASGTGFYPVDTEEVLTEKSNPGKGFLTDVCKEWEDTGRQFAEKSRFYVLRFGVILGQAGFLEKILQPARFFLGAVLGSGRQVVPWVHVQDVVNVLLLAMKDKIEAGTYNVVAPSRNSLGEITRSAAKKIKRPVILPNVPVFIVKLLFGERSSLLLTSQHVAPQKLTEAGYRFAYPDLDKALEDLLGRKT